MFFKPKQSRTAESHEVKRFLEQVESLLSPYCLFQKAVAVVDLCSGGWPSEIALFDLKDFKIPPHLWDLCALPVAAQS